MKTKKQKPARTQYERWAIVGSDGTFSESDGDRPFLFSDRARTYITVNDGERMVRVKVTVEEIVAGLRTAKGK